MEHLLESILGSPVGLLSIIVETLGSLGPLVVLDLPMAVLYWNLLFFVIRHLIVPILERPGPIYWIFVLCVIVTTFWIVQ